MNRRFRDFDELTQTLLAWNLDLLQLDRGRFRGDIFQIGTDRVLVTRAMFNRATWQRGAPPEGYRTFAFLTDPLPHMIWRKQKVSTNSVMAFPPGGELDAVTREAAFKVFTLSFSKEILAEACRALELPDVKDLLGDDEVVRVDPAGMSRLIDFLQVFCRDSRDDSDRMSSPDLRRILEVDLTRRFLCVLASSRIETAGGAVPGRDRALQRLEDTFARIPHELPSVSDLCRTAQVSKRTLEHAFRDRFGMGPASYLKTIRMNGTRKELLDSDPHKARIADVAGRWGFKQMSQFAADYGEIFGELPSSTLRRRRKCAARKPAMLIH